MTINPDRKPKTFLFYHKPTKRQKAEIDRLSCTFRHLPESLSGIAMTCPTCKTVFPPDWFGKQEMSMIPVKPKFETKGVPYTGPKRWVLQIITQACPKCKACVSISLPTKKMRAKGFLFGDDAEREHGSRKVTGRCTWQHRATLARAAGERQDVMRKNG